MKATDLLKQQHDEVKALFAQLERTEGARERTGLLREIAKNLAGHMVIEQEIFYPACREAMKDRDVVAEAYEEHAVAAFELSRVLATGGADETFAAKAKVLKELVEHHVEEEESEFLPEARDALGSEKLEALGAEMEALFAKAHARGPRAVLPVVGREARAGKPSRGASSSGSARAAAKKSGGRRTGTSGKEGRAKATRGRTTSGSRSRRGR